MERIIYETEPGPKRRYAVEWKQGGSWARERTTYRFFISAWMNARTWRSLAYPARVIDTWAEEQA